jgi:uncharacterized UPF0160 family protein
MQTVIVHSGTFHPDDVFAVATLQLHLGKENIQVIRTRSEDVISKGDWVADVGGVYDVDTQRFDHHQNGAPVRDNGIPYAAFGLVWKHLGESVTGSRAVADSIEERIAQPIDAGDNGVALHTLNELGVSPYELYNVVHSFRPAWDSAVTDDEAFLEAVDFARGLLLRTIAHAKAGEKVKAVAQAGYEAATDKSILVFEDHVDRNSFVRFPDVQAVLYPSDDGERGRVWKVAAVQTEYNTFNYRVKFPAAWAGLRDEELAQVSGIEGAIFCHKGCWLFVTKTKEGALEAARQAK